ncbi:MAG: hypothetical protein ACRC3Y_00050 [Romboutsia sp.]|uniref:hypothetical protein n=1 Tax=Romboutsia sp. TaxID=1965302 RepID=UPI003F39DE84
MKKYLAIFLITISTVFMVGCFGMSKSNSTNNSWDSSYKLSYSLKSKNINLDKEQVVKFNVVSEKGNLNLSIEDENEDICFTKETIETSTFEFIPEKSGKYCLKSI